MKSLLLSLIFLGNVLYGQDDSLFGTIRVSRTKILPYFSGVYTFKPIEPKNRKFSKAFRKADKKRNSDVKGKFWTTLPSCENIEKEITKIVSLTYSVVDTPKVDTVRILVNLSSNGIVRKAEHAGGSIQADDPVCKEIISAFLRKQDQDNPESTGPSSMFFVPGQLFRSTIFNSNGVLLTNLEFVGLYTIVITSFPVSDEQEVSGLRYDQFTRQ